MQLSNLLIAIMRQQDGTTEIWTSELQGKNANHLATACHMG